MSFEAVVAVCLAVSGEPCRDVLIPGFATETQADCEARLTEAAPRVGARCAAAGPALEVVEVAPNVFVHVGHIATPDTINRGDVSNSGFVIGRDGVAVIDTGGSAWVGEGLWRAIRRRTDLPVTHVVLTHMHPDHVLGAAVFEAAGAVMVGHDALPRALADRRDNYLESFVQLISPAHFIGSEMPHVAVTVADRMEIDLGDRTLELRAWPSAHSGSDLTVADHASGTLFAGDLVFDRHTPALDGSLRGWQMVIQALGAAPFERIVPGHGGPVLTWPEGLAPTGRYLNTLAEDTAEMIRNGERLGDAIPQIAHSEAHRWRLFDDYNPRNATVAFTELEWE